MARPNFESIQREALAKEREAKMPILNSKEVNNDFTSIKKHCEGQCNCHKEEKIDNVNKPKHYNREGGMESIDEMVLVFGKEAVKNFCLCNVWKYRYRAADKNGAEDLAKSDWYMRKYKELCDKDKKNTVTVDYWKTSVAPLLDNPYQE